MKTSAACIAAAIFLTGCAAPKGPTAEDDPSRACYSLMNFDARLAPLKAKVGSLSSIEGVTLEMRTSTAHPTADERQLLSAWASARQACAQHGEEFRRRYAAPGFAALFSMQQSRILDLIADLYADRMTYGEFVTKRGQVNDEMTVRFAEQQRQDRADLAARQRDAAQTYLMFQALQPRPAPLPMPTPPINCTTRYIGTTAYTSCQ